MDIKQSVWELDGKAGNFVWFVKRYIEKLVEEKFTSTNIRRDEIIRLLDCISSDERIEIFSEYCKHCGDKDPSCQCWNDE